MAIIKDKSHILDRITSRLEKGRWTVIVCMAIVPGTAGGAVLWALSPWL